MLELAGDVMRQYIDASSAFTAMEEAEREQSHVRGGMYWHKGHNSAPDDFYLVRTTPSGSEKSLGPRSEDTERIYNTFQARKREAQTRVSGLRKAVEKQSRMNRALRVGRVNPLIVSLLNRLAISGLRDHFRVVGTHALYVYESAAGVRVDNATIATQDIDLLWDARKRIQFATALKKLDSSMLGVLRKVDPTFRIRDSQKYTAINKDGFEVDILLRETTADGPHPVQLSDDENDFWVTQAPRAQELLDCAAFSAVIVATNGNMARMETLEPMAFVRFKRWMGSLKDRDTLKRRRDISQAEVVEEMVREYLPQWDKKASPERDPQ
jgi:hypothetical protein